MKASLAYGNHALSKAIYDRRVGGAVWTDLEQAFNLDAANGMTAWRIVKRYCEKNGLDFPGSGRDRKPKDKDEPERRRRDRHKTYGDLLLACQASLAKSERTGECMPVMLKGPAGAGKTFSAKLIAQELGLTFYPFSVGPQTSKSDILGYMDAQGRYVPSAYSKAFRDEKGALFLLDEMDAGNAGCLTVLNAGLAGDRYYFPDGVHPLSRRFVCVAACNTWGQGANAQYVGRAKLDGATLDRFVKMDWDYDEDFEFSLTGRDDWVRRVQRVRKACERLRIRAIVSPRAIINGAALLDAGMPWAKVEKMTMFAGLNDADRNKLVAAAA